MLARCYRAEPILILVLGNTAFWPLLFTLLSSLGHPVPDSTQHAIIAIVAFVVAIIGRQSVVSPSTADQQVAEVVHATPAGSEGEKCSRCDNIADSSMRFHKQPICRVCAHTVSHLYPLGYWDKGTKQRGTSVPSHG